jgi:hypothetical protein
MAASRNNRSLGVVCGREHGRVPELRSILPALTPECALNAYRAAATSIHNL